MKYKPKLFEPAIKAFQIIYGYLYSFCIVIVYYYKDLYMCYLKQIYYILHIF